MRAYTKSTLQAAHRAFWVHACFSALFIVPAAYTAAILNFINS